MVETRLEIPLGPAKSRSRVFGFGSGIQERSKSLSRGFQQASCVYDAIREPFYLDFDFEKVPRDQHH